VTLSGDGPRDSRPFERHLGRVLLQPVVRLADARRRERVRRRDVRAGLEVAPVDVAHDLRPREVEQVGVAGDVLRMFCEAVAAVGVLPADVALDEHTPRPVEDDDPLSKEPL
jgi:hypothetical protein